MRKPTLGNLELEILRYVTDHAPVSVGQVTEGFAVPRGLSRSTINTSMERLFKKGYLTRASESEGEVFRYAGAVPSEEVLGGLVEQFVEKIRAGRWSEHDGARAAQLAQVVDACYESAAQRREISLTG